MPPVPWLRFRGRATPAQINHLSTRDGTRERLLEGVLPTGDPVSRTKPSWLASLHIMRIPDAEALTERLSCCAVSEVLIEEGKRRTEMRAMSLGLRCLRARLTSVVCLFAAATAAAAESLADARA